jgi:hypothetical protein
LIREALKEAAPVQQSRSDVEPVAWRYDLKQTGSFAGVSTEYSRVKLSIGENWTPLYTTPPNVATPLAAQRQWVGLTDEQHAEAVEVCLHIGVEGLVFWLEDKLKEKNT